MIDERAFRWLSPIEKYIIKRAFIESSWEIGMSGKYTDDENRVHTRILSATVESIKKDNKIKGE